MNLDTTIDIDLKGFFRWWGKELAFLVPKTWRQRLREHYGEVLLTPTAQGFSIAFIDDDENSVVNRQIDLADNAALQKLRQQFPAMDKAEFILRLPASQALHRVIYLPAAVQENLQQVVSFELDRYTPFKAEQVYFNVIPLGQTGHGQLQVLLVVTPKNLLDEQLTLLESLELKPHRVDYQTAVERFPNFSQAVNLLPARLRPRVSKIDQSLHWLSGGLLLLLSLAVLIWPVWMAAQSVDSLKARIKQLEKQNRVVDVQQREIAALYEETQKLIDIKHQSPALLPVLNALSKLLNDETWLTHLRFSGQQMQIQGQSPSASALIGILEGSDYFSNVSFVSPLTQDKTTGRERFQIKMEITMPLLSAAEQSAVDIDGQDAQAGTAGGDEIYIDMPDQVDADEEEVAGDE